MSSLLVIDRFVDSRRGKGLADTILDDLLAVDVEVDSARLASEVRGASSDSESVMSDLLSTDRIVDSIKSGRRSAAAAAEAATAPERAVDPYLRLASSSLPGRGRSAERNRPEGTVLDLLAVDELIDGSAFRKFRVDAGARSALMEMIRVDEEVGSAGRERRGGGCAAVVEELLAVDAAMDRSGRGSMAWERRRAGARAAAAFGRGATDTWDAAPAGGGGADSSSAPPPAPSAVGLTGALADLYEVDRIVGGAARDRRDDEDVEALVELLDVDREVDSAKERSAWDGGAGGTFEALLAVDREIDRAKEGTKPGGGGGGFFDPLTASVMGQIRAASSRPALEERALSEVAPLLKIDHEIDGEKRRRADIASIRPLLEIDMLFLGNSSRAARDGGVDAVAELLAVDREIDAARGKKGGSAAGRAREGRGSKASQPTPTPPGDVMAELYATDCLFDSSSAARRKRDDIKAIMDLVEVDREVDRAKRAHDVDATARDAFEALLEVDRAVDGAKGAVSKGGTEFIDPITAAVMGQIRLASFRPVSDQRDINDVSDLLVTDRAVDGRASSKADMDAVRPLLEVDREFRACGRRDRRHDEVESFASLLSVDRQIDAARAGAGTMGRFDPVVRAAPQKKRSIFSAKEKRAAMKYAHVVK